MQRITTTLLGLALVFGFNRELKAQCSGQPNAGTISAPSLSICTGGSSALSSAGLSVGADINYQWQISTGGAFTNISGATGSSYNTGTMGSAGTYSYQLVSTCTVSSLTNTSNVISLTVVPTPSAGLTVLPNTGFVCEGGSFTITTTNGTATSWTLVENNSSGGTTNTVAIFPSSTNMVVTPTVVNPPVFASVTEFITYSLIRNVNGACENTVTTLPLQVNAPFARMSPIGLTIADTECSSVTVVYDANGANNYTLFPGNIPFATTVAVTPINTSSVDINLTYTVGGLTAYGCYTTNVHVLTVLPRPTITSNANPTVICQGQSAVLTASSNLPPTTYTWTGGGPPQYGDVVTYSPMATTVYTINAIGANGCSTLAIQSLSVRPIPSVNAYASLNQTLICSGKSTTLIAHSNPETNNYSWNFGPLTPSVEVSPTVPTVYTVTSTYSETGCSNTRTVLVNVFTPEITITPASADVCRGTTVTLSASGALTSYTWSLNGNSVFTPSASPPSEATIAVSPTATTIYTLMTRSRSSTITALHCELAHTVQVNAHNLPTVSVSASRNPICQFESTELFADGATTYTWTGGLSSSPSVAVIVGESTVIYTVTGADTHNCQDKAVITISVGICYGVEEIQGQSDVRLFPNPSTGEFTVHSDSDINLNIISQIGQVVKTISLSASNNHTLEINDLPSGIYFIVGSNSQGTVKKKMVISR